MALGELTLARRLLASGLLARSMALSGCTRDTAPSLGTERSSDAEVTTYLQAKAEDLYPDVLGLKLTGLRFSEDRTLVCGWVTRPGQQPLIFTSADRAPETLDRSIGLPPLEGTTSTILEVRARDTERYYDLCRRSALMPERL